MASVHWAGSLSSPFVQNEFLRFDGAEWINDKISVVYIEGIQLVAITGLINDLADVNVAGATLDQRLGFDGSQWRAVDAAELSSIDAFADVDTTGKTDGDALGFDGGTLTWGAVDIGGLGASNRTTIVTDIATMLGQSLKLGDQTYVQDGATTGEWEIFLLHTLPGSVINEWSKIATLDSAAVDARTIAGDINVSTISPVLLGNVSTGSRVTLVSIDVSVPFEDGGSNPATSVLTVGTDDTPTTNTELASDLELDLTVIGTYTIVADVEYNSATLTIDTDGSGTVSGVTLIEGGSGYIASTFNITTVTGIAGNNDAVISYTVTDGVMTAPTVSVPGTGYTINQTSVPVSADDASTDTDIKAYFSVGDAVTGNARVLVTYV